MSTSLVEGGSRIIMSMLADRLADRIIVAVAPTIMGAGTQAEAHALDNAMMLTSIV